MIPAPEMPSNTDPKEKRTANLPPQTWRSLEELADATGNSVSEMLRRCVELGISETKRLQTQDLAYENAKLVRQKLFLRMSDIRAQFAVLTNPEATTEEKTVALAAIESKLSD